MANITKEIVLAQLAPQLTEKNAHQLLKECQSLVITPQTLMASYPKLSQLYDLYKYLEKYRKDLDKPERDNLKERKAAFDTIMKPIAELLEKYDPIVFKVNEDIFLEEQKVKDGISKRNEIIERHMQFVNEIVRMVVSAPDNSELTRVQKLIGSEKSRTGFYGDHFENVEKDCDILLGLVTNRKNIIKENAKLQKDYDKCKDTDLVKASQLRDIIELNQKVIEENGMAIANDAFNRISALTTESENLVSAGITPRTHRWSWKVTDMAKFEKEYPQFTKVVTNDKEIDAFVAAKKKELSEEGYNELGSLVIYYKPYYLSVTSKQKEDAE